jgi:tripartite motif-containing protein 71
VEHERARFEASNVHDKERTTMTPPTRPTGRSSTPALKARSTLLGLAVSIAVIAAIAPSASATQAVVAPTYVRTIGSPGQSDLYPSGLDVDSSGNVAVADTGNDRVEFFAAGSATPTWSVGTRGAAPGASPDGFQNPRDVAVDNSYVYVADTDNNIVQVLSKADGSFVKKIDYKFVTPIGVSVGTNGSGNERILVSSGGSGAVDVFSFALAHLMTISAITSNAGTRDAATDSAGNIYTADYRNDRVDKYSPTGTLLLQWGGSGATTCHKIPRPYGVDVDAANHVYVASSNLSQIKEFNADGSCVATFGTKGSGSGQLLQLRRVAAGPGTSPLVFGADLWGLKILAYEQNGSLSSTQPQLGSGVYPPAGGLNEPHGIAVSPSSVFVTDTVNQRMQRFDLDGSNPIKWGDKGTAETSASFNWAQGVGYNPQSGNIWVANTRNNRMDEFGPDGSGPLRTLGHRVGGGDATFNWPMDVVFDASGHMYVADTNNNRIQAFTVTPTGITSLWITGSLGTGVGNFNKPWGVAFDGTGATPRVLVADMRNSRIVALNANNGNWLSVLPIARGPGAGRVKTPRGIAVAGDGSIWIADTGNSRIEMFNNDGTFANELVGTLGSANDQFNFPQGIRIGPGGLLYVADAYNNRIQVFQP